MALQARPTTYRGIPMRSRLEARFARYLDVTGADWKYEPRAYADATGDYLPDFEVTERRHHVFIELKREMDPELIENADVLARAMQRMEVILESEPDASLMVVTGDKALLRDDGRWQAIDYPWTRTVPR